MAVLYLGNLSFTGQGEDDAKVKDPAVVAAVARLLSCETAQLEKAICTQNMKAGLDWISKPNTVAYASDVKNALTKARRRRRRRRPCRRTRASAHAPGDSAGALLEALRLHRRERPAGRKRSPALLPADRLRRGVLPPQHGGAQGP